MYKKFFFQSHLNKESSIQNLKLKKQVNLSFENRRLLSLTSYPKYCIENSFLFSFILKKFISKLMKNGKKFKSEKIFKKILVRLSLKGFSPINTLILAINNVKPILDVRKIHRKGKNFHVPILLKNSRRITKSIQTLLRVSKNKLYFEDFLVDELINSMKGRSRSLKVTLRLHKFAFQNRSFSYYRWF